MNTVLVLLSVLGVLIAIIVGLSVLGYLQRKKAQQQQSGEDTARHGLRDYLKSPIVLFFTAIIGIPFLVYLGLEFKGWLENPPFTPREMAEFMWVAGAVLLIAFCTLYIVATMTPWKERIRAALWMLPIMFGVAVFFALVEWLREPSDERVVITQRLTTEEQPFSFNDRGLTVVVGQTDDFICLFPLPDAGNYTFRLGDGSAWAQGARARTATMFLQAPPGETRSVVGFLHPTEACSRT
ncbi:hypothetical protein A3E65_02445 [Candidatus Kaiserbacteria bacterium RIFCSPHIGHO2_12_FULL_56_13]|uniref:Uncharacterized protein n=1 Tax=Candidatus Kaiserbacteria bacterium RIFCSPHIGHO2_12_FULL_56_13 TaxID=1798505 RepID=A0A1F6EDZ5_9BACT|nr:MAG: hypothetical protein A3E65_02445 [Candidatus Kaiserbacteria bacterium RIFCSPHIGHO2_12_FULL_56_13]